MVNLRTNRKGGKMTLEHDAVRERLLADCRRAVAEGGLASVRARDLAARAGVSVGTIYNLFGNLDGLLQAVGSRILADFEAIAARRIEEGMRRLDAETFATQEAELTARLLVLADTYLDYLDRHETEWTAMMNFNRQRQEGRADDWYLAQQQTLFDWIGGLVGRMAVGSTAQMRQLAARALWSSVHGIVSLNYLGQRSAAARLHSWRQIELLVTCFVRGASQSGPVEGLADPA